MEGGMARERERDNNNVNQRDRDRLDRESELNVAPAKCIDLQVNTLYIIDNN